MELTALKSALNPSEVSVLEQALTQPVKSIADDSDIELTENEIAQALLDAKIKKRALLQYMENERLRQEKSKDLVRPFDYDELINFCLRFYYERFGKRFLIDGRNEKVVVELAKYFTGHNDFNKGSLSVNKGVLIMGNVGSGKTSLMAFFQKNKKQCYTIKSCNDIAEDYLVYKEETSNIYSSPIEKPIHDAAVFFQKQIGYCFDDLGTENIKNSFGNKKDVMADIILSIYDKYKKKDFTKFHITTNLNDDDLLRVYGERIYSRINEMFNIFSLTGKDRRL